MTRTSKSPKPKFLVEGTVPRKKISFEIKVTAAHCIAEYARYLSNQGGFTVSPDAIVERLAEELVRDKNFKAHLESVKAPGVSAPPSVLVSKIANIKEGFSK